MTVLWRTLGLVTGMAVLHGCTSQIEVSQCESIDCLNSDPSADYEDSLVDAGIEEPPPPSDGGTPPPPPPPPPTNNLAATGLCVDAACRTIKPGIHEFRPKWQLYSDGETKRRWIFIPAGKKIDTASMDYWRFPVGTKLWKEFTRNGVRVETRYMVKTGTADTAWTFSTYTWKADQSDAVPASTSGMQNVNGTPHDIPPRTACLECHGNVKSRVLGFSMFQLDYAAPAGVTDVDDAIARGWLTVKPPGSASPHFPVPGNASEQAMLGYFHANCGHCHNSDSQLVNRPMFRLEVAHVGSLSATRTYQSTVNVQGSYFEGATIVAKPGYPDRSILLKRMTTSDKPKRMPALGIETPDSAAVAKVRDWITNL